MKSKSVLLNLLPYIINHYRMIRTSFSKREHVDSGLALLLITLLLGLWINQYYALPVAIVELVIILVAPVILYPFTFFWLNLSELLGRVMSKVILTVIYAIMVCPVGLIRKAMGKDPLQLRKFKQNDNGSVFTDRHHVYTKSDFTAQY